MTETKPAVRALVTPGTYWNLGPLEVYQVLPSGTWLLVMDLTVASSNEEDTWNRAMDFIYARGFSISDDEPTYEMSALGLFSVTQKIHANVWELIPLDDTTPTGATLLGLLEDAA